MTSDLVESLDEAKLRLLAEDPEAALYEALVKPQYFGSILAFLIDVSRVDLSKLNTPMQLALSERAANEEVTPVLRRSIARALPPAARLPRLVLAIIEDASKDVDALALLGEWSRAGLLHHFYSEPLLVSSLPALRELAARSLIQAGVHFAKAVDVLVLDGKRDLVLELAGKSKDANGLRSALAFVSGMRATPPTAAQAAADVGALNDIAEWLGKWEGQVWPLEGPTAPVGFLGLLGRAMSTCRDGGRLDVAVRVLAAVEPERWAWILREEAGWDRHPEFLTLLLESRPDVSPGVLADLCGLFSVEAPLPRERVPFFGEETTGWKCFEQRPPIDMLPLFVVDALQEGRAPDRNLGFLRADEFAFKGELDELDKAFRASPPGRVAAKLANIVDPECKAAFRAWFERRAVAEDWDAAFGTAARAPYRSAWVGAFWPFVSHSLASRIASSALRHAPIGHALLGRRDLAEILTGLVETSDDPVVRLSALVCIVKGGGDVRSVTNSRLLARTIAYLIEEGAFLAAAEPLVARLFMNSDGDLLDALPWLSGVIGPALNRAGLVHTETGPQGERRLVEVCLASLKVRRDDYSDVGVWLGAPCWARDKVARRRLAEGLGGLPDKEIPRLMRAMPGDLAWRLAASPATPVAWRAATAAKAFGDPAFDPKRCSISDDPEVVARVMDELQYLHPDEVAAAKHIVRAAINLFAHRPPNREQLDEQAAPYFRVREGFRVRVLSSNEVATFAVEHLAQTLSDELRTFVKKNLPRDECDRANALIAAAARLEDLRPISVVKMNSEALGKAGLGDAVREVTMSTDDEPQMSDATRAMLAFRALRRG
jgi:hypothetical protein